MYPRILELFLEGAHFIESPEIQYLGSFIRHIKLCATVVGLKEFSDEFVLQRWIFSVFSFFHLIIMEPS